MGYYKDTKFLGLKIPDWADVSKNDFAGEVELDKQLSSSLVIIDEFCSVISSGTIGPEGPSGSQGPEGPSGSQGPEGPSVWGGISGSIYDQADLSSSLENKANISGSQTFIGGQRCAYTELFNVEGTVDIDLSLNNNFVYTVVATGTLAAPTNSNAGQAGIIEINLGIESGTLILDPFWKVPSGTDVNLTVTSGALDALTYNVKSDGIFAICNLLKNIGG